jgi:hypothetical protein
VSQQVILSQGANEGRLDAHPHLITLHDSLLDDNSRPGTRLHQHNSSEGPSQQRGGLIVISVREHVHIRTFGPFSVDACIDGFFYFFPVEAEG